MAGCYEGDIEDTAWVIAQDSTSQPIVAMQILDYGYTASTQNAGKF